LALLDQSEDLGVPVAGAGCETLGVGWYCGAGAGWALLDQEEVLGAGVAVRLGAATGADPLRLKAEGRPVLTGAMGAC
jgi:hypothetical protein